MNELWFKKRSGTTDVGKSYEDSLVALIALKLAINSDVRDYLLSSNDVKFGNLDDVVLKADFTDQTSKLCALQLKHSQKSANLTLESLLGEKGDFSIQHIFKELQKAKETNKDLEHFDYILYTNKVLQLSEKKQCELRKEKKKENVKKEEKENLIKIEISPSKSINGLINTSTQGGVYKFKVIDADSTSNNSEEIRQYEEFFKHFYLYACQKSVQGVREEISKIFKENFGCNEDTCELYNKFIEKWSAREKKKKLSKTLIRQKCAECLLTPYIKKDFFLSDDAKLTFVEGIIGDFDIIITGKSSRVKNKKLNSTKNDEVQLRFPQKANSLELASLIGERGDFSLLRIFKELQKIKEANKDSKHLDHVLCTSKVFTLNRKQKCELVKENRFKVEISPINSENHGDAYQFKMVDVDPQWNNPEEIEQYQQFFDHFQLYSGQKDFHGALEEILKIFEDSSGDTKKKFIEKWKEREQNNKLNITLIGSHMKKDLFSSNDAKLKLVEGMIGNFDIIIGGKFSRQNDIMCIKRDYELTENNPTQEAKIMWHLDEFPLTIEVPDSKEELVRRAVDLCQGKKFILIGNASKDLFQGWKVFQDLSDLKLFDISTFKCQIQGRRGVSIEDVVGEDWEKATVFNVDTILRMIDNELVIGEQLETSTPYINRFIPKILINLDIIEELDEVLVVSCNGHLNDIARHCSGKRVINIDDHFENNDDDEDDLRKHVFVTDGRCSKNDFTNICLRYKKYNVHHLGVVGSSKLEWLSTKENIKALRKYVHKYRIDDFVKDDQILEHYENGINVILADPGMGKSITMDRINNTAPANLWPVKIDLKEHYEFFVNEAEDHDFLKYILNYMAEANNYDTFTKNVRDIFKQRKAIVFLWDGIDELSDNNSISCAIREIKRLEEMGYRQWIAGRSHLKDTLEKECNVFALNIRQFDEKEQEHYILERLQGQFENLASSDEIVKNIIDSVKISRKREILGVPLHIFMLTENYRKTKQFNPITLTRMYDSFINGKFSFHNEKMGPPPTNALMKKAQTQIKNDKLRNYKGAALLTCFDDSLLKSLDIQCELFLEATAQTGDEHGLVVKVVNGKVPIFAHQTYAEFLSALYFKENYSRIKEDTILLLFEDRCRTIRYMFDMLLAEDTKASCTKSHLAVLDQDYDTLLTISCDGQDLAERNSLQLACTWGVKYPLLNSTLRGQCYELSTRAANSIDKIEHYEDITKYLAMKCDPSKHDNLLNLNSFGYADRCLSLHLMEIILEAKKCQIDLDKLVNYKDVCTVLYYSIRFNYPNLFGAVTTIPYLEIKEDGNNLLHLAATHNRTSFLRRLLETENYAGKIDKCNKQKNTPLHLAAKNGQLDSVKILIEKGAKIDPVELNPTTPLQLAVRNGHLPVVEFLIENKASTRSKNKSGETLLHLASNYGHLEVLTLILDPVEIDARTNKGETPLHLAARSGHIEVVKLLKQNGAQVDAKTKKQETPLHLAALTGQVKIVEFLLDANQETPTIDGDTALHLSTRNGHLDVVKYLIQNNANINAINNNKETPLQLAIINRHSHIIEYLLVAEADVNISDNSRLAPLHLASRGGNRELVERLLQTTTLKIDMIDGKGCTALHYAARNGSIEIVKMLTEVGSDVNAVDDKDNTPLQLAIRKLRHNVVTFLVEETEFDVNRSDGDGITLLHMIMPFGLSLVKILVERGAVIDVKDNDGQTPLHYAIANRDQEIAMYLIEKGADINIPDLSGNTVLALTPPLIQFLLERKIKITIFDLAESSMLHYGARHGCLGMVELLIREGEEVNRIDGNGSTPLLLASENGHLEVVQVLIGNEGQLDVADRYKRTPLHEACRNGHVEIVKVLITKGATIDPVDNHGNTPLHLASDIGSSEIVSELLAAGAELEKGNHRGYRALHFAANSGHNSTVKLLIKMGADVNSVDNDGYSPFYLTMEDPITLNFDEPHVAVAETLLNKGTNVTLKTRTYGHTPLHSASGNGCLKIVELLLKKGADIDAVDNHGSTPLETAVYNRRESVVEFLLNKGARFLENTPLHTAVNANVPGIVILLMKKGASVNQIDRSGSTPLHVAVSNENLALTQLLIEHGAVVNAVNEDGNNALHVIMGASCDYVYNKEFAKQPAPDFGVEAYGDVHDEIIELLVKNGIDDKAKNRLQQTPAEVAESYRNKFSGATFKP